MGDASAAISCSAMRKAFGATKALDGAEFEVAAGGIHALVGENGAGKTTLMRLVAGELTPDSGQLEINGRVGIVRQHLSTVAGLTATESIVFGAEPRRHGRINWRHALDEIRRLVADTRLTVPLNRLVSDLPVGLQQRVELLGALYRGCDVLLLDEPTTHLTPHEVESLFDVLKRLVLERQLTVVFVSHKLREVESHCDSATVLRRGQTVGVFHQPFSIRQVGRAMTGETQMERSARARANDARPADTWALETLPDHDTQLRIAPGEIIGIAGVAGNGQDEFVAHLAGTETHARFGAIRILGSDASRLKTIQRRRLGLRVIPSDARDRGAALEATLVDNLLTSEPPPALLSFAGRIRQRESQDWARHILDRSSVTRASSNQAARELSGGNLQRLVVGRETTTGGRVLVAHEPTKGVDIAGAAEIRSRIASFAADGGAVLLLSSDLDELIELTDRIHVFYEGTIVGTLQRDEFSFGALGELFGGLDERTAA
jgi:ABC-type uncharacterized transport system ATPase subunit